MTVDRTIYVAAMFAVTEENADVAVDRRVAQSTLTGPLLRRLQIAIDIRLRLTVVSAPQTIRVENRAKRRLIDKRQDGTELPRSSLKCHRERRYLFTKTPTCSVTSSSRTALSKPLYRASVAYHTFRLLGVSTSVSGALGLTDECSFRRIQRTLCEHNKTFTFSLEDSVSILAFLVEFRNLAYANRMNEGTAMHAFQ